MNICKFKTNLNRGNWREDILEILTRPIQRPRNGLKQDQFNCNWCYFTFVKIDLNTHMKRQHHQKSLEHHFDRPIAKGKLDPSHLTTKLYPINCIWLSETINSNQIHQTSTITPVERREFKIQGPWQGVQNIYPEQRGQNSKSPKSSKMSKRSKSSKIIY